MLSVTPDKFSDSVTAEEIEAVFPAGDPLVLVTQLRTSWLQKAMVTPSWATAAAELSQLLGLVVAEKNLGLDAGQCSVVMQAAKGVQEDMVKVHGYKPSRAEPSKPADPEATAEAGTAETQEPGDDNDEEEVASAGAATTLADGDQKFIVNVFHQETNKRVPMGSGTFDLDDAMRHALRRGSKSVIVPMKVAEREAGVVELALDAEFRRGFMEMLFITVVSATGLESPDPSYEPDPLCEVKMGSIVWETSVKTSTITPTWQERFDFTPNKVVTVKVYDDDKQGRELMGSGSFALDQKMRKTLKSHPSRILKVPLTLEGQKAGAVRMILETTFNGAVIDKLTITVNDGMDLLNKDVKSLSDPLCQVTVGHVMRETAVLSNTLSPRWKEAFDFTPEAKDEYAAALRELGHEGHLKQHVWDMDCHRALRSRPAKLDALWRSLRPQPAVWGTVAELHNFVQAPPSADQRQFGIARLQEFAAQTSCDLQIPEPEPQGRVDIRPHGGFVQMTQAHTAILDCGTSERLQATVGQAVGHWAVAACLVTDVDDRYFATAMDSGYRYVGIRVYFLGVPWDVHLTTTPFLTAQRTVDRGVAHDRALEKDALHAAAAQGDARLADVVLALRKEAVFDLDSYGHLAVTHACMRMRWDIAGQLAQVMVRHASEVQLQEQATWSLLMAAECAGYGDRWDLLGALQQVIEHGNRHHSGSAVIYMAATQHVYHALQAVLGVCTEFTWSGKGPESGDHLEVSTARALFKALGPNRTIAHVDLSSSGIGSKHIEELANLLKVNTGITAINLSNCCVPDAGCEALAQALEGNTVLTSFVLSGCSIGESATHLFKALEANRALSSLDLSNNNVGNAESAALAKAMAVNTTLIDINLSVNGITEAGAPYLAQILQVNSRLKSMALGGNHLSDFGCDLLAVALRSNTALTSLDLRANGVVEGAEALLRGLECNSTLQLLDLSENGWRNSKILFANPRNKSVHILHRAMHYVDCVLLASALASNATLTSVSLRDSGVAADDCKVLAQALEVNAKLSFVDLAGNKIDGAGCIPLAKALEMNKALTSIILDENSIGNAGAVALGKALEVNSTLTVVKLRDNQIGMEGGEALGNALRKNTTVCEIDLGNNEIGEEGSTVLFDALAANGTVTSLRIDGNNISDAGGTALGKALQTNCALAAVHLSDNCICDGGSQAIFESLEANRTLTTLDLDNNLAGAQGMRALRNALTGNSVLKAVHLDDNDVDDHDAAVVFEALETNTTLTALHLNANKVGYRGGKALAEALHKNTTIRSIHLRDNSLPKDVKTHKWLADALDANNFVKYMDLRGNPIDYKFEHFTDRTVEL